MFLCITVTETNREDLCIHRSPQVTNMSGFIFLPPGQKYLLKEKVFVKNKKNIYLNVLIFLFKTKGVSE